MNPLDFEKLLADFSDEPQLIEAQRPINQSPQAMPDVRDILSMTNTRPLPAEPMQESNLDQRRLGFEDLMSRLEQAQGEQAFNRVQQPQAPVQSSLGAPGDLDKAIAERNEQQKKAQLLKAFNKILQGGATYAGAKIDDGSELADALERQAGQGIDDIKTKESMQLRRNEEGREASKQELIMKDLQLKLDKGDLDFQDVAALQDPASAQSTFVQDEFIRMQKAMGQPVNEDAVRQQNANILYKVSPWMQKVFSDSLRLQLDRTRLSNEDTRLKQAQDRLDLLSGKEIRLTGQFDKTFEDKQQEQSAKVVDKFEKDKVVQKSNESISQADNVINLVQSENPIGHSAIPTFMARASGEVGNLSEADKAPFGGSQAISSRIKQVIETYQSGELTPENQKFVIDLANTMKRSAVRNKASRAIDLREKYSKSYKMDKKDVNELMMKELNNLDDEDSMAVEWALKNPTDPKASKILQLHGL